MNCDIKVKTWTDLMTALYTIPKTNHRRFRSDFVYRGVASASWGLDTSLQRLGTHAAEVEHPLMRSFVKYAQPGEIPSGNLWFRLAAAQHHGLPTRLLDWSVSPKVALHFATAEQDHYDEDGAIWCVDVVAARKLLPASLRNLLDQEWAFLFSVEMLEQIASLEEFDQLGKEENFVMFFEPPSLDARIINQGAIMSAMPGVGLDLRAFLKMHPGIFHRIIIPKSLKWEVRDKLDQDNVTERMLFPGLDGLSRWLKRYYGAGPKTRVRKAAKPSTQRSKTL